MTKRRRKDTRLARKPQDDRLEREELKPRAFVPRACTACTKLREAGTSYSIVYAKVGRVRYCRCKFCDNTWTQTISADQQGQFTTHVVRVQVQNIVPPPDDADATEHGNSIESTGESRRGD